MKQLLVPCNQVVFSTTPSDCGDWGPVPESSPWYSLSCPFLQRLSRLVAVQVPGPLPTYVCTLQWLFRALVNTQP